MYKYLIYLNRFDFFQTVFKVTSKLANLPWETLKFWYKCSVVQSFQLSDIFWRNWIVSLDTEIPFSSILPSRKREGIHVLQGFFEGKNSLSSK